MSFADCVEDFVRTGRFSRLVADELYRRKKDAMRQFRHGQDHPESVALRNAEELVTEQMRQQVRHQKYQVALQAMLNRTNEQNIRIHGKGQEAGIQSVLTRDPWQMATWKNVDTETKNIVGQAHADMTEGLSQLRTRWFGFERDHKMLKNVMLELHGTKTGDVRAAKFAEEWAKVAEEMRQRFNRAGGSIPFRKDYGAPQNHDSIRVAAATKEDWLDFTMDLLDVEKMTDMKTGLAFSPEGLREVLEGVYDTISTNGASDMIPGAMGGRKVANRRQDHRFLVFKDAEAWVTYQQKFGEANMHATLMGHIDSLARDIALMEILGPNPTAGFRYLEDVAAKANALKPDKSMVVTPLRRIKNEAAFNLVTGTGDKNKWVWLADVMGITRAWNVTTKLLSASISAISDQAFGSMTLHWNDLSYIKHVHLFLDQLNPADEASKIMAGRTGMTVLSWVDSYSNVGRYSEVGSSGGSNKLGKMAHTMNILSEAGLRLTGLNALTDANRRAIAVQFSMNLADNFGKSLDELRLKTRQSLTERGMTAEDWDMLRQTPTTEYDGGRIFTIDQLMARTDITLAERQHLASRIQSTLNEEITHGTPEPDAAVRIYTTGGKQRGTPVGEGIRGGGQFKSFSFSVLSTHANRVRNARRLRGPMTQAAYIAEGIILTTMLGYVAWQLKHIKSGRNPVKFDKDDQKQNAKILAASFLQGGGSGIWGDVLFSDVNRFGGGLTSTFAGPTAGLINDTAKLTLGNLQQLMQGEDTDILAESINYASRYTPGNNIWFSQLLIQREITDQIALWADPRGARRKFKRQEKYAKDLGTDFYWRPGERKPDNPPDLGVIE